MKLVRFGFSWSFYPVFVLLFVCFNILENEKHFLADRKLVNWQFHLHLGSVILKAFNLESVCLLGWLNFKEREILPTKKQNAIFLFQMFSPTLKTVYLNWFIIKHLERCTLLEFLSFNQNNRTSFSKMNIFCIHSPQSLSFEIETFNVILFNK